jgi:hypothetical protein
LNSSLFSFLFPLFPYYGISLFLFYKMTIEFFILHSSLFTLQTLLIACLLKEEAIVRIILKPAQALATYDTFWPFACHEIVKIVHVERTATAIDKRANAIFFNLATLMVVMV